MCVHRLLQEFYKCPYLKQNIQLKKHSVLLWDTIKYPYFYCFYHILPHSLSELKFEFFEIIYIYIYIYIYIHTHIYIYIYFNFIYMYEYLYLFYIYYTFILCIYFLNLTIYYIFLYYLYHHHVMLLPRISLTLSRHSSLSSITPSRSSTLHPVLAQSCGWYIYWTPVSQTIGEHSNH